MPGSINGAVLAREARKRQPKLKVLLTTGYSEALVERTEGAADEFEIINKPYRRTDLFRRVRHLLDGPTGRILTFDCSEKPRHPPSRGLLVCLLVPFLQNFEGCVVRLSLEKAVERLRIKSASIDLVEQGHRRVKLYVIQKSEDIVGRFARYVQNERGAFLQARAKQGRRQISHRLVPRADRIAPGHGAMPQSFDLRKDKPHPVRLLAAPAQLTKDCRIDGGLRADKALQVEPYRCGCV